MSDARGGWARRSRSRRMDALSGVSGAPPDHQRPSTAEVVPVFLRQAWAEARVRYWRHVRIRSATEKSV